MSHYNNYSGSDAPQGEYPNPVYPPEAAWTTESARGSEDFHHGNFDFQLQGDGQQHQQQHPNQPVDPSQMTPEVPYSQYGPQFSSPQIHQPQSPLMQQNHHHSFTPGMLNSQSANRPSMTGARFDSRTNSEVYPESITSAQYNFDSRFGSEANLLKGSNPQPHWAASESTLTVDTKGNLTSSSQYRSTKTLVSDRKSAGAIFGRDWIGDGSIIKLADRDDIDHIPQWKRYLFNTTPFWVLLSSISYFAYFSYRIVATIQSQRQANQTYPMAWIFIAIEITIAVPTYGHLFMTMFMLNPRKRPKLRLTGDDVPDVDCFITCCREETDLVLDTVRASCDIDYPVDRFRVIVLDDGRDQDLQEECERLQQTTYFNLYYMAREKIPGKPHHFKAGNLNYGFDEVAKLPGGPSHFAAALDADMIPEKHWLRALMPHMLLDERMAMACPPQLFYNVPKDDPLCQSLDFFVHVLEGIKDSLGVAWCTGSGYVLRREALEDIGWFPLGSLAEDVATSTLMLGKGWHTSFVHEPLQFGTVPDSFGSHLKQRTRWAIGTVDTAFKLRFCLWGDAIKQMTFYQRMSGFIYAVLSLFNIFMSIAIFAFPIVLLMGKQLVAFVDEEQLRWLIRLCFITLLTNRLTEVFLYLPAGYAVGMNGARSHYWMGPYIAITLIRTFILPTWLGGQKQAFKPTGSINSELNERDAILRKGLITRLRVIIFNYMGWYHILFVYFVLIAVTLTTARCLVDNFTWELRLRCLLTHAFWPPISWILVVSAFWVPITYAIDPPSVPPRDELLDRDPKTGVAHPKDHTKVIHWGRQHFKFELEYTIMLLFTAFVFAAAFVWI